jgi:isoleucyl-tRNA synthetase
MDRLDIAGATGAFASFIEALNNWYIRRSREEFWKADTKGKQEVYDTLYTVLVTFCRTMAPFLPYLTEHIHLALQGESVHLQDWPDARSFLESDRPGWLGTAEDTAVPPREAYGRDLVKITDFVRDVCSAAASIRTSKNLRNRLPLRRLIVAHPIVSSEIDLLETFGRVIREEANVKEVVFEEDPTKFGAEVLAVNARVAGKRLGGAMKEVLAAAKAGNWKRVGGGAIEVAGQVVQPEEYELRFRAAEGLDAASFAGSAGVVVLDTKVDADLEREGVARDFIRLVQVARKDAGFNIADRIQIEVKGSAAVDAAIAAHADMVKGETLAVSYRFTGDGMPAGFVSEGKLGDESIAIGVKVA